MINLTFFLIGFYYRPTFGPSEAEPVMQRCGGPFVPLSGFAQADFSNLRKSGKSVGFQRDFPFFCANQERPPAFLLVSGKIVDLIPESRRNFRHFFSTFFVGIRNSAVLREKFEQ
jgi:hypothetical protein